MLSIVIRELRDRRYSIIAYCAITLVLLVIYIALFPSVKASMDQFQQIYESYPKGFYQALGLENISVNSLENYLSIEMYSIVWQLLALLLAISLAGYTLAGQIDKGTIGFYLALPLSRTKLFVSKYLAGLTGIVVFVVMSVGITIPLAALFHSSMPKMGVLNLSILSLLFAWAIYSVALFLSALFSERGAVYTTMGGLLISMYAMNVIASLRSSLAWLDELSIFHYYNAQRILGGNGVPLSSTIIFSSSIALFTLLGLIIFRKRDISV